jgi:diguanylate cyclase (GGDEF)-like protein
MCDIDFFKHANDTYGHQAGDYILRKLGRIMTTTFRKTDTCCRYGGEEFLIILPTANLENACRAAEKLRRIIETEVFEFNGKRIDVTVSCGVATIDIFHETAENTISRADAALYYSKNHGRNSISYHSKSKISPFVSTLRSTVKKPKVG